MKTATINELKKSLGQLSQPELQLIALKLAKYKKENKELLTYLLFESSDEASYILSVQQEVDGIFEDAIGQSSYYAKKTIRKALKITNKYIKYSSEPGTDIDLLIHFLFRLKQVSRSVRNTPIMLNMHDRILKRINTAINKLHEDLQYDYRLLLEENGLID